MQVFLLRAFVDPQCYPVQILIDTIDAAAEVPEQFVQRSGIHSTANRVDIYAVALYLFAQLYIRQAQRADAMDVWPSSQPFGTSAAVTVSLRRISTACKAHTLVMLGSASPNMSMSAQSACPRVWGIVQQHRTYLGLCGAPAIVFLEMVHGN